MDTDLIPELISSENEKVDTRIAKTREAIARAFLRLIEENEYPEITVTALAREAGISRKTFYLHYRSVDELLRQLVQNSINGIIGQLNVEDDSLPITELVHDFTVRVISLLRDHPYLNGNLVRCLPLPTFLSMVRDPLIEACRSLFESKNTPTNLNYEYWVSYYLGGLTSVYETWKLTSGEPEELDEVAEFVSRSATLGLSTLINSKMRPLPNATPGQASCGQSSRE